MSKDAAANVAAFGFMFVLILIVLMIGAGVAVSLHALGVPHVISFLTAALVTIVLGRVMVEAIDALLLPPRF
jgi:hypothetical protein